TEVLAVHEKAVRIRRPAEPLPEDAMAALLAFHENGGISSYYTQLMPMPDDTTDDLILWRTASLERQELRSVLRVPADSPVSLRDDVRKESFEGRMENISGGGARVITASLVSPNTDVWLTMQLPEHDHVRARGRIAHVARTTDEERYSIGIKFTEIQPEGMNAIRWYITSRIRDLLPLSK